jgi:hypothetical protein
VRSCVQAWVAAAIGWGASDRGVGGGLSIHVLATLRSPAPSIPFPIAGARHARRRGAGQAAPPRLGARRLQLCAGALLGEVGRWRELGSGGCRHGANTFPYHHLTTLARPRLAPPPPSAAQAACARGPVQACSALERGRGRLAVTHAGIRPRCGIALPPRAPSPHPLRLPIKSLASSLTSRASALGVAAVCALSPDVSLISTPTHPSTTPPSSSAPQTTASRRGRR